MKKPTVFAIALILGVFAFSAQSGHAAPQQISASKTGADASQPHSWTTEQAVTSSVREAWVLGGRTEEGFFEIVRTLAELSAQNRGITLPDNKEAGIKTGNWIKKEAKRDPDQLLYAIVDRAVQYGANHKSTGAQQ